MVDKAFVVPPKSLSGPVSMEHRQAIVRHSGLRNRYTEIIDRESAYEMLQRKAKGKESAKKAEAKAPGEPISRSSKKSRSRRELDTLLDSVTKAATTTVGRQVARELVRGILGSFLRR